MVADRQAAAKTHGAFAVVMATGIVSIALAPQAPGWLSRALAVLAIGLYAVLLATRLKPVVGVDSFAFVAATSVVGVRLVSLVGDRGLALASFGVGFSVWLLIWVHRPALRPLKGASLLAVVGTQSLAILAVRGSSALAPAGLAFFVLGLALYFALIVRLPLGELRIGKGDVWITMGALAISALAAADLARPLGGELLRAGAVVLWIGASIWIAALASAELRWPRLSFEPRRWATTFTAGMYAAASGATAAVTHSPWLMSLSHVLAWIALAIWGLTAAGALRERLRRI